MVLSFQFECDRDLCLGNSSDNWKHENGYMMGQQFRTVECLWGNKTCHGEDFSNEQQEKRFCSTYVDPDPDDSSNYFCSKFYYKDENYKKRTFKCQAKHYSRRGSKRCKNFLPKVVEKCDDQKLWSKSTKSGHNDTIAYRFCNDSKYGLISEKTV